jgi:hypothetical protein
LPFHLIFEENASKWLKTKKVTEQFGSKTSSPRKLSTIGGSYTIIHGADFPAFPSLGYQRHASRPSGA